MKNLSKEQAVHCANVFENYFQNFNRIDDYMRVQKLMKIKELPTCLPGMDPSEDLFSDFTMLPEKMNFQVLEIKNQEWDKYIEIISSHTNMTSIPGRSVRLAVKETNTNKWVGFIRLGSPMLNCKPRNEMLREVFSKTTDGAKHFNKCAIMGFVIVPTQPFGFNYLGGKLLAALCTSHEVREILNKKYKMNTCLFETTSLYGSSKSVSQYDGMKPLIRFKGLTESDFMPFMHGKSYSNLKNYVEDIVGEELVPANKSSRKLMITTKIISMINQSLKNTSEGNNFKTIVKNAKNLNEKKRYYISDYGYKNMIDYVNRKTDKLIPGENYEKFHQKNLIEWWRKKAINRYKNLKNDNRIRTEQEVWTNDKVLDIIR